MLWSPSAIRRVSSPHARVTLTNDVLRLDRTASKKVSAPTSRCMEVLRAVEAYPSWASLIAEAQVLEPGRVRLRAQVMGIPLEMVCSLEIGGNRAVLTRLPYDPSDDERYVAIWTVRRGEIELHVEAELDAPSAAGLMRGRIERRLVDDLLRDFVRESEKVT